MAEYLVQMQVNIPPEMPPERLEELRAREKRRGLQLRTEGTIQRVWRVPGRVANIGYWQAPDATVLHEKISSLPMFPWLDVTVTALAQHYLEAEDR
ncbi:MAG: muconolactone delta-isomerase [Nitriliruptorales bacterium]|nr:muconolactone delta-isomerase [Nitriliruptorales bacterium]